MRRLNPPVAIGVALVLVAACSPRWTREVAQYRPLVHQDTVWIVEHDHRNGRDDEVRVIVCHREGRPARVRVTPPDVNKADYARWVAALPEPERAAIQREPISRTGPAEPRPAAPATAPETP
jgi:hypothetical protein